MEAHKSKMECILFGFAVSAAVYYFIELRKQRRRSAHLILKLRTEGKLRQSEHNGRINAEKELRAFTRDTLSGRSGLFYGPIATLRSCFKECVGTPRQGQFAPSTIASLVFDKSSVSPMSFEGLEDFSHIWVFWAFHLNTNAKDIRAHAGVRVDSRGHTFPAKVSPPFLKRRVGVFSTRSPHRPNPIGISLCKVYNVNPAERTIILTGVDLVDGTPVLDIKPYVPDYDQPPATMDGVDGGTVCDGVRVAEWVKASVQHRRIVEWTDEAERQLHEACFTKAKGPNNSDIRFFRNDPRGAQRAISETLAVDVRSLRKTREAESSPSSILRFDALCVEFDAQSLQHSLISNVADVPTEADSSSKGQEKKALSPDSRSSGGMTPGTGNNRPLCGEANSSAMDLPVVREMVRVISVTLDENNSEMT